MNNVEQIKAYLAVICLKHGHNFNPVLIKGKNDLYFSSNNSVFTFWYYDSDSAHRYIRVEIDHAGVQIFSSYLREFVAKNDEFEWALSQLKYIVENS